MKMKNKRKLLGQGMTEYIIIVALIAIAAVAVYGFFGQAIRSQMSNLTEELSGEAASDAGQSAAIQGANTEANTGQTLQNFGQQ